MAEISAGQVKELRELTGLPMMECKKALAESGGDLKKAEELLRIKGSAKASRMAGRAQGEGIIGSYVSADAKLGALVEVNCETDFVARNEDVVTFANSTAELVAAKNPADAQALLQLDGMDQRLKSLVQKIGENISIGRLERMPAKGRLARYLHGAKIGVLVDYEGADEVGKDVAMHISFAKPAYMSKAEVPQELVAEERRIQEAKAKESGKPADIVAKMVEGAVSKWLGERTLLGQPFVKDDKQTVEKMLTARKSRVLGFKFLVIEKK